MARSRAYRRLSLCKNRHSKHRQPGGQPIGRELPITVSPTTEHVIVRDVTGGDATRTTWKKSRRFSRWRTNKVDIIPSLFLSCLVTLLVSSRHSTSALSKVPPILGRHDMFSTRSATFFPFGRKNFPRAR